MVRLKGRGGAHRWGKVFYFNSSMVRLKVFSFSRHRLSTIFQFQHGTIKSEHVKDRKLGGKIFQFQHGTIKRKPKEGSYINLDYFNSSMVRLKVIQTYCLIFI